MMKDVLGFENTHSVCDDGRIFSKINNRFLNPKSCKSWYVNITLTKGGVRYSMKVHRIVARAFLPNPNNYKDVNHKNGIKYDNRVDNLEWCSRSHNQIHAYKVLGRIPVTGHKHPKYRPILDINTGIFYHTSGEAAMARGFTRDQVKSGIRRHGNYNGLLYA